MTLQGFPVGKLVVKNPLANAGDVRDTGSIPWRRAQQPTPVFLRGESHGQEPGELQSQTQLTQLGTHTSRKH